MCVGGSGGFPGGPVVRINLAMQRTLVPSQGWEDPTCCGGNWAHGPQQMTLIFGTSEPLLLSPPTTITGAHALQQEKPLQWETLTPEPEKRPHSQQLETAGAATKTEHSQREINIFAWHAAVHSVTQSGPTLCDHQQSYLKQFNMKSFSFDLSTSLNNTVKGILSIG